MNQSNFYLDWVPYSVNSAVDEYRSGYLPICRLKRCDQELIVIIYYVCRSDGILFFEIEWNKNAPTSALDRIGIAHDASREIKEAVGHQHVFNTDIRQQNPSFPTISVSPIELDEIITIPATGSNKEQKIKLSRETMEEIAKNDSNLYRIEFAQISNKERHDRTAIFLIRKQYAQTISKALRIRDIIRNKTTILNFKLFDWKLPTIVYSAFVVFFLLYRAYQRGIYEKDIDAISLAGMKELAIEALNISCTAIIFLMITIYILTISIKRRKILKALVKSRVYLRYGDLFNSIVSKLRGYEASGNREPVGFSHTISIIGEIVELEEKKRKQTQITIAAIGIPCVTYLLIKYNLLSDGLINTLKILGIVLPKI